MEGQSHTKKEVAQDHTEMTCRYLNKLGVGALRALIRLNGPINPTWGLHLHPWAQELFLSSAWRF